MADFREVDPCELRVPPSRRQGADPAKLARQIAPMIHDVQREAMAVLNELWALSPDVRFGQLLAHLGFLGEAHLGKGLGYIEDDELIAIMYRHRAELLARVQGMQVPMGAATSVSGSSTLPQAAPIGDVD